MSYQLSDFAFDLRRCTSHPDHIWVGSGSCVCSPIPDCTCGVRSVYAPPFSAGDASLRFQFSANGHSIVDDGNKGKNDCGILFAGAQWQPDRIVRQGTYHFRTAQGLISFSVRSETVPLFHMPGVLVKIGVRNRMDVPLHLDITPLVDPGCPHWIPFDEWDYCRPANGCVPCSQGEGYWENDKVRLTLCSSCGTLELPAKAQGEACFALVCTESGQALAEAFDPLGWEKQTVQAWEKRLCRYNSTMPTLRSDIPGLEDYYKRSVVSGLVALWESDRFAVSPFPATSGLDGGAVCCYQWSISYNAEFVIYMLGEKVFDLLRLLLQSGIDSHICMSLSGHGQGTCSYSYNLWSILYFYYRIVTITGRGLEWFDTMQTFFEQEEDRLPEWASLKDYGEQHNMLEMRSCGYEHYVVSPNAERAFCYEKMADLAHLLGRKEESIWRNKAHAIRTSILENLWNADPGWFDCVHPGGHRETVYSIQIFDALRMIPFPDGIRKAVLSHLKDGAFLSDFGVSSVSREDTVHYETNDPDWSGAGCYTGDGAELARTLWEMREPRLAWDILSRLLWMGRTLPYYPQEHYCDKPMSPAHKRANDFAGVCGMEAIVYGLAGVTHCLDGSIIFDPQPIPGGNVTLDPICHRGVPYALSFCEGSMGLSCNGKILYEGEVKAVRIP